MERYELVTIWRLDAPLDAVWDALHGVDRWPGWWRGLESVVELEKGGPGGIGSLRRFFWKGALPYRLRFDLRATAIEPSTLIAGTATGDLEGAGVWRLSREAGFTVVRYEWSVRATIGWMNALGPLARPLLVWNHDKVMAWGGAGLARHLGARLLEE